jgi:Zn-dependent protease with chaperone function
MTIYSWQPAFNLALASLQQFAQLAQAEILLQQVFGAEIDTTALLPVWQKAEIPQLPEIVVIPSAQINGAKGAYAAGLDTIYLSQELVESSNQELIAAVFLEEYGHYLDQLSPALAITTQALAPA